MDAIAAQRERVPRHTFRLRLKEREWRFNRRSAGICQTLLKLLRSRPL